MKSAHIAALIALAIGVAVAIYVFEHRYRYIDVAHDGMTLVTIRHDNWTSRECVFFAISDYTMETWAPGRGSCYCEDKYGEKGRGKKSCLLQEALEARDKSTR